MYPVSRARSETYWRNSVLTRRSRWGWEILWAQGPQNFEKTYRSSVGTENRVAHILLILASSSQWSRKVWGLTPERQNDEELEDKSTFGGFFQRGEVVPWSEVWAVGDWGVGLVVWNLPHKGRSYDFDSSPNLQLWIRFLQDLSIVHPGLCGSRGSRWKVEIYAVSRSQCPPNGTWMIQRCKSTWISDLALHVHKEFLLGENSRCSWYFVHVFPDGMSQRPHMQTLFMLMMKNVDACSPVASFGLLIDGTETRC